MVRMVFLTADAAADGDVEEGEGGDDAEIQATEKYLTLSCVVLCARYWA